MTTNLKSIQIGGVYRQKEKPLENFYGPCLKQSIKYDRAVGYFRSTAYALTTSDILPFIENGGKIRLICSTEIPREDVEAIYEAYKNPDQSISNNISQLITELNEQNDYPKVLASLIKFGHLDIKFIFNEDGIFHEKWGIFYDDNNNNIYFNGSYNETYSAWDHEKNQEVLSTLCSWKSDENRKDILSQINEFELYWENSQQGSITKSMNDDVKEELLSIAYNEEYELKFELIKIKEKNDKKLLESSQIKLQKKEISLWDNAYDHQKKAIEEWKKNNKRGLIAHATGSGKTYTGILALNDHFKDYNYALVTIPSDILQQQWADEIKELLPGVIVLKCGGSGRKDWRKKAEEILKIKNIEKTKIIFLAINISAQDENFLNNLSNRNDLLLLSDEVHSIGSKKCSIILEKLENIPFKMGLSATPHRMGDQEGNLRIKNCFGGILQDCIFTIADGIRLGYLSKYNYHPFIVSLTAEESDEWDSLTKKIQKRLNYEGDERSEHTDMLIFRRSRLAKKAQGKYQISEDILRENWREGSRWLTFLEDQEQINELRQGLLNDNLPIIIYHSELDKDIKSAAMKKFKRQGGIILSIRCLDEGVDIPSASKALIVASSQNYRQFIQRRGRVLRRDGDKIADIYDILINPRPNVENNYIKKELQRSYIFAKDSENKIEGQSTLNEFALAAHIDPAIVNCSLDEVILGDEEIDDDEK
jgi:superfamily II DNA or RNA helicase